MCANGTRNLNTIAQAMSRFIKTLLVNTSWLDLHITDTHTQTQETGTGLDSWRNAVAEFSRRLLTLGSDDLTKTSQTATLIRDKLSCWTMAVVFKCTLTNRLLQTDSIFDGTNKRNPEPIQWRRGMQMEAELIQLQPPHFGNHPVWFLPIGLYQIQHGPPCLAPPYSNSMPVKRK